jgi:hypothetical protein
METGDVQRHALFTTRRWRRKRAASGAALLRYNRRMPVPPAPQPPAFTPTFAPVPPGPLAGPLQLLPINAAVMSVHTADGAHVGSLKLAGGVWKFKAIGYDAAGRMEPGHGPLTQQHNMAFATPDAAEVSARLLKALADGPEASA